MKSKCRGSFDKHTRGKKSVKRVGNLKLAREPANRKASVQTFPYEEQIKLLGWM